MRAVLSVCIDTPFERSFSEVKFCGGECSLEIFSDAGEFVTTVIGVE